MAGPTGRRRDRQVLFPDAIERGLKPSTTFLAQTRWPSAEWLRPSFIWVLGLSVLLGRLFVGTLAVRRMARSAAANQETTWQDLIQELSGSLSLNKPVRLLFSDSQISPMTWGVLRHTVVLPSQAQQWGPERRRLVLAHEIAHVKRNDGIIQLFVQIVCGAYWFNPLVWYAAHRIRIERERACDDHVLKLGAAAADYADHLVQIVRGMRTNRSLSFAAVSMAQPSQLETRLVSILDSRIRRQGVSRVAAACLSVVTCLLTVSIAAIGVTPAVRPVVPTPAISAPQPPATMAATPAPEPQRTRIGDVGALRSNTVVPPRVIESKPPIYTDEAIAARIEGTVTLETDVDAQGKFKILRVVKGLGFGLDQRAMGTVLDWKFAPATRNGISVRAITQVDVDFKLPPPPQVFLRVGNGVTPPLILSRVEPHYTDEARQARSRGTVVLEVVIRKDGTVDVLRVARGLGFGLDESAVEAIKQWRFKPGTRNGEPVDVALNVEINFNLK